MITFSSCSEIDMAGMAGSLVKVQGCEDYIDLRNVALWYLSKANSHVVRSHLLRD